MVEFTVKLETSEAAVLTVALMVASQQACSDGRKEEEEMLDYVLQCMENLRPLPTPEDFK